MFYQNVMLHYFIELVLLIILIWSNISHVRNYQLLEKFADQIFETQNSIEFAQDIKNRRQHFFNCYVADTFKRQGIELDKSRKDYLTAKSDAGE